MFRNRSSTDPLGPGSERRRSADRGASLIALLLALAAASCTSGPAPLRPYFAFVVNEGSSTLALVNLGTLQLTSSISLAPQPIKIIARPGTDELWILSRSGTLTVIKDPGLQIAASIHIGSAAAGFAMTQDGRLAAAYDPKADQVRLIDCNSRAVAGRIEAGAGISALAFTADGEMLVASDAAHDRLVLIGTGNHRILGEIAVGKEPGAIALLRDGSKLFVADVGEAKLSAIDLGSRQVLSNIELASAPGALVLKPDQGELIALGRDAATLMILDTFHDDVETEMPAGAKPAAAVITKDSSKLYIANAGDGTVEAIDLQNRVVLASTRVGVAPNALALTPDERVLAVADPASSTLAILGTEPLNPKLKIKAKPPPVITTLPLITTISVGARPVDVVIPDWLPEGSKTSRSASR